MDAKTLEALKASIAKWEKNAEAKTPEDANCFADSCPLCDLFSVETNEGYEDCTGCPVAESAQCHGCGNTPWQKAARLFHGWRRLGSPESRAMFHMSARDEAEFLKSLLPAGEVS